MSIPLVDWFSSDSFGFERSMYIDNVDGDFLKRHSRSQSIRRRYSAVTVNEGLIDDC